MILAGGTVNSPQLLMLSGIGPADELKAAGISAIHDLPGVGKNLQDHPMVSVGYLCTQKISLDGAETLGNFLRWLLWKNGPLASNVAEAGLFLRTRAGLEVPDLQLLFGPAYYRGHGLVRRKEHCFGFGPTLITPESRGEISLRSANPLDAPAIRANYLSTDADLRTMIAGVRLARRLAHAKAFDQFRGEELHPGAAHESDAEISEFLRNELETLYHPVGTCKMGVDALAVVDARLRVRGIERAEGGGCVHHAARAGGKYECAGDDDRGKSGGDDSRRCLVLRDGGDLLRGCEWRHFCYAFCRATSAIYICDCWRRRAGQRCCRVGVCLAGGLADACANSRAAASAAYAHTSATACTRAKSGTACSAGAYWAGDRDQCGARRDGRRSARGQRLAGKKRGADIRADAAE